VAQQQWEHLVVGMDQQQLPLLLKGRGQGQVGLQVQVQAQVWHPQGDQVQQQEHTTLALPPPLLLCSWAAAHWSHQQGLHLSQPPQPTRAVYLQQARVH
jgi:hypothetical protein